MKNDEMHVRGLDAHTKKKLQQKAALLNISLNRLMAITLQASVGKSESGNRNNLKRFVGVMKFVDGIPALLEEQRGRK